MAAIAKAIGFPRNPSDGDQYTFNGKKWRYNVNVPGWEALQVTDVTSIKKDTSSNQVIFGNNDTNGSTSFNLGSNITMDSSSKTISVVGGVSSGLDADLVRGINGSLVNSNIKTGILYGGVLSVNSSDNSRFDISAGSGVIISYTNGGASGSSAPSVSAQIVTWSAQTSVSVSGISSADTTWIYVNSSGGIGQQTGVFTSENYQEYIIIGALVHPNRSSISFISSLSNVSYGTLHQYDEFIRSLGPAKISGHRISANGSNMKINRSSGTSYLMGSNYALDSNHPNFVSDAGKTDAAIHRYYSDGAGNFTISISSSIDGSKYDNGSGTLQNVSSSNWSIQRLFYYPGNEDVVISYYGTVTYSSLSEATSAISTETFSESPNTKDQTIFCGWLIVRGGATQLNNTSDAKFVQASVFREIISGSGGGGGSISYISELLDVETSAPSVGQALIWDGSNWVNQKAITYISELDDVQTSSPSVGQFLVWDGSNWVNQSLTGRISYIASPSAPSTALYNAGDRWYNTSTGIEYTLINDGDDLYWVNIYISPNEDYIMSELTTFMKFVSSSSAPSTNSYKNGDKWFNSETGTEFTLIDDGDSKQWVNLNTNFISHVHPISEITGLQSELDSKVEFYYQSSPPSSPNVGDRWMDDSTGEEYIYVYDGTSYQWMQPTAGSIVGVISFNTTHVTSSSYSANSSDCYIGVNYAGLVTVTLPSSPSSGKLIIIKDESGNAGSSNRYITIVPASVSDYIDNDSSAIININNGGVQLIYRNGWRIV